MTFVALGSLLVAVFAWAGVGYLAWTVMTLSKDVHVDTLPESDSSRITASRVHAFLQNSSESRATLKNIASVDLLAAINMIELSGKPAGIKFRVSDASVSPLTKNKSAVKVIGFVIEADGSYGSLLEALEMMEALPYPAVIDQFDLGRTPISDAASVSKEQWHISMRMRLLTTAAISS